MRKYPAVVLSLACIAAVWQLVSLSIHSALVLPGIPQVLSALARLCASREFWAAALATFLRCILATAVSVAVGVLLGCLSAKSRFAENFLTVPLWIVKATPVVALVLVALFWFRAAYIPVFVASLLAVPVVYSATQKGMASADSQLLDALCMYGLGERQLWRFVRIPGAVPFVTQGISSAYGLIWKAVAAGEVLALPKRGLGTLLNQYQVHLETASVFAVTVMLIASGYISEALFRLIARAIAQKAYPLSRMPWRSHPDADGAPFPAPCAIHEEHLSKSYGQTVVLNELTFDAEAKSVTALIAPSGSGKTTLLSALAERLKKKNIRISYVYQEPRLVPQLTLFENVCLPLSTCMSRKDAETRAHRMLLNVGLATLEGRLPSEVSGGERQRASLARAAAYPSPVLLMDEAFQSQDAATECRLLTLLSSLLSSEPKTVVLATHNVREACCLSDRICVMRGTPLTLHTELLSRADRTHAAEQYIAPDDATAQTERAVYGLLTGGDS